MVPSAYIEKPPFPVRIKDHSKASTVIRRGYSRTPTPPEQIRVEPSIAIIKDLLSDYVDGHDIHFCEDVARIAKPHARDKHRPVVGTPVVFVKIGDHCYVKWVLVLVQYLNPYMIKSKMRLHLLR